MSEATQQAQLNAMIQSYQHQIANGAAAIAQLEGVIAGLRVELEALKTPVNTVKE